METQTEIEERRIRDERDKNLCHELLELQEKEMAIWAEIKALEKKKAPIAERIGDIEKELKGNKENRVVIIGDKALVLNDRYSHVIEDLRAIK